MISLPEQPVTVLSYMGADGGWVLDAESQQALLLDSIGFDYVRCGPQQVFARDALWYYCQRHMVRQQRRRPRRYRLTRIALLAGRGSESFSWTW
ncbi:hypothetical protein cgR_6001 [Corynebacterium glutamicum R]|uniref:Uncharacterized protein n=1 Tax=Corynebacterium glutamicum (strain R) TaxID=340322 RepID=A0AB72VF31_CORGB|nr:hypothetical protein cgR_6001 [Corynebacterium glutamicum R]